MRQSYSDLYALFRREPGAETFFNSLPPYVQDQVATRYRAVDSFVRLVDYAAKAQNHLFERHYPVEEIGGKAYLPAPMRF